MKLTQEQIWKEKQKFLKYIDPEGFRINSQLDFNYSHIRNDLLKKIYREFRDMAPTFRSDAQYILTTNEWKLFEVTVGQVLRHNSKIYSALKNSASWRQGPFGAYTVEYGTYQDMRPAKFTDRFRNLSDDDILAIETGTQKAYGPVKPVYLDMDTIASARRVGRPIIEDHAFAAAELIAHKWEQYCALGTGWYNWPDDEKIGGASGMTGLFNASGVNTLGAGGGGIGDDDDMTAAGDFVNTVGKMRSKLVEDKHYGNSGYILVATPGIITQLALNSNATRATTEWESIRAYLADSDVKFQLVESKYIGEASAALTNSTQEMMLIDPIPRSLELIETYPLGQKLELNAEKPQDLKFALVGRGALVVKDATCICITVTLTTTNAY